MDGPPFEAPVGTCSKGGGEWAIEEKFILLIMQSLSFCLQEQKWAFVLESESVLWEPKMSEVYYDLKAGGVFKELSLFYNTRWVWLVNYSSWKSPHRYNSKCSFTFPLVQFESSHKVHWLAVTFISDESIGN